MASINVTQFVASQRESALLIGDYSTYRTQLSRRLRTLRRKLGRATPKNAKYSAKPPVTSEDIASNHGYAHLLLLSSERAWAQAMYMKAAHAEDNADQGITGSTRKHIVSRLHKAAQIAAYLVSVLPDSSQDALEAQAYASSLAGAEEFERQSEGMRGKEKSAKRWQPCLSHFVTARVLYHALCQSTTKDIFKEVLASVVDPSIRYAAYQSSIPRTVAVSQVAVRHFPKEKYPELLKKIETIDPHAFSDATSQNAAHPAAADVPNTVQWRGRTANIVDAAIGQALASSSIAETKLSDFLQSEEAKSGVGRDRAAAYDDVLIASQDATDATRHAIDELEKEGVEEGDSRMQDLRITSLAVNYSMIGWRIGRNRVLIGEDDGLNIEGEKAKRPKRPRKDGKEWVEKEEGNGRKLARLRERVVLYDAILQSIDAIKELRGAARDTAFIEELDAKRAYYQALKCLNLAFSHTLISSAASHAKALALFDRALTLSSESRSVGSSEASSSSPPRLDPSTSLVKNLNSTLQSLVLRYRALVHLHSLTRPSAIAKQTTPLVARLHEYPAGGADLNNLVTYPPKLVPIPVKPIFLDVAWNYIDYPGRAVKAVEAKASEVAAESKAEEAPKKKGWFGFGR